MSRLIASFLLAAAIGILAGTAAAQTPEPETLLAQAQALSSQGKHGQAIAAAEKALASVEQTFGPEHPFVVKALKLLAELYEAKGEPAKAAPLYRRAIAIAEKSRDAISEVAELKVRLAPIEAKLKAGEQSASQGSALHSAAPRTRSLRVEAAPPPPPPPAPTGAAARSLSAPAAPGGTIPVFPWPPPSPSASYVFPREVFARYSTVGEVTSFILKALESSGYVERSFFQTGDGGVALVTRLEKIGDDGTPAAEDERWPAGFDNKPDSFISFVRGLFFAPAGHYRVIVFVVQEASFRTSGAKVTGKDAEEWLKGGVNTLSSAYANRPFGKDSICTALIYEFASDGATAKMVGSSLTGKQHLQKAGVLARLISPN